MTPSRRVMTRTEAIGTGVRTRKVHTGLFAAIVITVLAMTRIPLAPKYLYYFDSANFALALEDFNPLLHQPQPPGYPMFVGLMRLLHLVIPQAEHVLLVAGLLIASAAMLLVWRLATEVF